MKSDRKSRRNKEKETVELKEITPKNIKIKILNVIVTLFFCLSSFFTIYTIITIKDILPTKYIIISIALILIILIVLLFFMYRKKTGRKSKIAIYILSVLFTIAYIILSKNLNSMDSFMQDMDISLINLKTYYVIVLNNSDYEKIEDLKNKDIGYYHNELINTVPALEKMNDTVVSNLIAHVNIDELGVALQKKEVEAILVEDSYKIMLEEETEDFTTTTRVIYQFEIEEAAEAISKEVTSITTEPFVMYVSGIDSYGEISSTARSDVNMLITVNPTTNQILLTSIPRDYYVKLHGTSGYKDKLTHAGIYGIEMSISTIEDLMNVDINYYFKVNFTSLIDIINILGGVTVYSEQAFTTTYRDKSNYSFVKGENVLNGKEALAFVRERKAFPSGDRIRGIHQQEVIQSIIKKASSYTIVSKFESLLNALNGKFKTNMGYSKMQELVKYQLTNMPTWHVITSNLKGYDSRQRTYSCGTSKFYIMVPTATSVRDARDLIQAVIKGEAIDGSYQDPENKIIPAYITSVPKEITETTVPKETTNTTDNNVEHSLDNVTPYAE